MVLKTKGTKVQAIKKITISLLPVLGLLILLLVFYALTDGNLFSLFNLKAIFQQCYLFIIGCLGVVFLMAQGALDLSTGSLIGLCSILAAYSCNRFGIFTSFLACLATGTIVGILNGIIYSESQIPVFIQGLSVNFLIKGLLYRLTGGQMTISINHAIKQKFDSIGMIMASLIVFALITFYLYQFTILGKHSRAIGAGQLAAQQSGVNVRWIKRFAFIFSGTAAGLVAFFTLVKTGGGGPTVGTSFEFNILIAMTLGGMPIKGGAKAKVRACFLGAAMMAVYTNGMVLLNVDSRIQEIVKGVVFIIIMMLTSGVQFGGVMRHRAILKPHKKNTSEL